MESDSSDDSYYSCDEEFQEFHPPHDHHHHPDHLHDGLIKNLDSIHFRTMKQQQNEHSQQQMIQQQHEKAKVEDNQLEMQQQQQIEHTQLEMQQPEHQQDDHSQLEMPEEQQQPEFLTRSSSSNAKAPEFVPNISSPTSASPAPCLPSSPTSTPCPSIYSMPVMVPPTCAMPVSHTSAQMEDSLVNQYPLHNDDQSQDLDSTWAPAATSKPVVTKELKAKIAKQVEFYFSDANLPTDKYLMKFVRRDPEGYVPIPVVASLPKMKNIARSRAVVATALRGSKQLVVSEDGKKVRRVHPLPDVDHEEVQSRTVVAENLPEDYSISSMKRLFGTVGNVKMIRICHPEGVDGVRQTSAKFIKTDMIVSNKLHALIEYESVEQAERAVSDLTDQRNWRIGLHVRPLLRRTFQNKHSHQQLTGTRVHKSSDYGDGSGGEEDAVCLLSDAAHEKTGEESFDSVERSEEHLGHENVHNEKDEGSKRGRGQGRGRGRGRGQFHPVGTPPHANSIMPRTPDGTRGFTLGRGKSLPNNST